MRIAAVSDMHGNYYAFWAALKDIQRQGIDRILLLGDYTNDLPHPNECVNSVRRLQNAMVVRGNKEDYIRDLPENQALWTHEQFRALYWNARALTPENRAYIDSLPESGCLEADGVMFYFAHRPETLLGKEADEDIRLACERPIPPPGELWTLEQYRAGARRRLAGSDAVTRALLRLPPGVYVHGHYHTQHCVEMDGRLLINAGSCGLPQDGDARAAYTVITTGERLGVSFRRVPYDVDGAVRGLKESSLYSAAQLWCDITILMLRTGDQYLMDFFRYITAEAKIAGVQTNPFPNAFWLSQGARWLEEIAG